MTLNNDFKTTIRTIIKDELGEFLIIILATGATIWFFGYSIITSNILSLSLSCCLFIYSFWRIFLYTMAQMSMGAECHNSVEDTRNMISIMAKINPNMFGISKEDAEKISTVGFFEDDFIEAVYYNEKEPEDDESEDKNLDN